jgi:hypothetical protein
MVSPPILFDTNHLPMIRAHLAGLVGFVGDKGVDKLAMVKVCFNRPSYCETLAKAHDRLDLLGV